MQPVSQVEEVDEYEEFPSPDGEEVSATSLAQIGEFSFILGLRPLTGKR